MLPNGPTDPAGPASSAGNISSGGEPEREPSAASGVQGGGAPPQQAADPHGGGAPPQQAADAQGGGAPPQQATPELTPSPPFASLGNRFIAQIVDALVSLGIFVFVGMAIAVRFGGLTPSGFELQGVPALIAITIVTVLVLAYFSVGELLGATFGKLAAGIRVRTVDGGRVSGRAAVIRNVLRLVDGIALYLVGVLFVLFTKRNQRLGDLVAGTIVVRRETRRALRIAGLVGAAAVAVAGIAGGISVRPAAGPPRYASVILTDERTGTTEKSVFSPTTPEILLRFTIADVPPNTSLRSVWIAESVQGAPPNTTLDEAQVTAGPGATGGNFSWSRPTAGHPVGAYRVDLYIGEQLARTVRFTVEGAAPTAARAGLPTAAQPTVTAPATGRPATPAQATGRPAASIPRYATARLTDERTGTTEKTVFSPDTPQVFVHFTLADVPPNTTLRSVWIAESVQGAPSESRMDEATLTTGRDSTAGTFSLSRPTAGWPVGQYRVELYMRTQLAQTLRFRVEGVGTPTPRL